MDDALDYAFPHSAADEARRLDLFQQRLDPLTIRRMERIRVGRGARCLEIGGGRGSITRWLAERVGPTGRVTATDLQLSFLEEIDVPNLEVLRHDIRTDGFPERSFDLVHARAVLMHVPTDVELLRRMVSWRLLSSRVRASRTFSHAGSSTSASGGAGRSAGTAAAASEISAVRGAARRRRRRARSRAPRRAAGSASARRPRRRRRLRGGSRRRARTSRVPCAPSQAGRTRTG